MTENEQTQRLGEKLRAILNQFSDETVHQIGLNLPYLIARAKLTMIAGGKPDEVIDDDTGDLLRANLTLINRPRQTDQEGK